jgi:hypothetical protein
LSIKKYHPALIKVKYTNEFLHTNYFQNPKEAIGNWYRIKSDCWSYEEEIRIVLTNLELDKSNEIYIPISRDSISIIYLGSKIDPADESIVKSICASQLPVVKVLKMRLKNDIFSLIPE